MLTLFIICILQIYTELLSNKAQHCSHSCVQYGSCWMRDSELCSNTGRPNIAVARSDPDVSEFPAQKGHMQLEQQ